MLFWGKMPKSKEAALAAKKILDEQPCPTEDRHTHPEPVPGSVPEFRNRVRELRTVLASELVADEENWRTHPPSQERAMRAVLKDVGYADALLVRELDDGRLKLIDGHLRRSLNPDQEVPVLILDVDEDEARTMLLTFDPITSYADADRDKLKTVIDKVRMKDDGAKELIARIARSHKITPPDDKPKAGKIGDDAIPVFERNEMGVKDGDLFRLGDHYVMCGDCKNKETIAEVMQGEEVQLILTDPPYCSGGFQESNRGAGTWGNIASDNLSTRGYQSLISSMFEAARTQAAYVFTDWRMWVPLLDTVEACGVAARSMIVWDKKHPALGNLWRAQHELIMYACRSGGTRLKGIGSRGNVVQCSRTKNELHYTQKPIELLIGILDQDQKSQRKKCTVLDPFAGSGSTLIAAEKVGRKACCIDVEPAFVDVMIRRWQEFTGKKAEKVERDDNSARKEAEGAASASK